jgi:hypothetical protein
MFYLCRETELKSIRPDEAQFYFEQTASAMMRVTPLSHIGTDEAPPAYL